MVTKIIYFTVGDRQEQAEFSTDFPAEDIKDLFRVAAEAGPHDILKLYNANGNIINISTKLQENTPNSRYKLEVVAILYNDNLMEKLDYDLEAFETRIQNLEKKILIESGEMPTTVYEVRHKVEQLTEKLETLEHLSWLGLFKDISYGSTLPPLWNKHAPFRKCPEHCKQVYEKFLKITRVQMSDEVRVFLQKPTFDHWQWEDAEMMVLLQQMFIDLNLISIFKIELSVLQRFLYEVYIYYNNVPFHNFRHCFAVAQMMYGLIWMGELQGQMTDLDILILLVASICHDLDHPGFNNAYQVNAQTELALRYNDISPLENHHCVVAFDILEKKNCNIFRNLVPDEFKKVREGMIRCILATDMARHSEILNKFKTCTSNFDFTNPEHISTLSMILIKVSDISNEARPMDISEPWLDCLLQEFFNQGDLEKLEGLPVAPFMDREKVTKPSSQIGFIRFILLPLFEALGEVFPVVEGELTVPVRQALEYYTEMGKELEEKAKKCENVIPSGK